MLVYYPQKPPALSLLLAIPTKLAGANFTVVARQVNEPSNLAGINGELSSNRPAEPHGQAVRELLEESP